MIKKGLKFIFILILCIANLLGVLYFLSDNKTQTLKLYETVQTRELYRISNSVKDIEDIETFVEYVKTLKISSTQNWYIYKQDEDKFFLYKDKVNQYIDSSIKNVFIKSSSDYLTKNISDVDGNALLLTTKVISINDEKYVIGVSENISALLNTVNNLNFSIYILAESALLSLIILVLFLININNKSDFEKEKKKILNEFEEYKTRFAPEKKETKVIKLEEKPLPVKNEDGSYTLHFLDLMISKLEENNVKYETFEMTDDKFWIIEDCIAENMYKIKKTEEDVIVLLIDGTDRQRKLLKTFE